jgi:hypothetical protein
MFPQSKILDMRNVERAYKRIMETATPSESGCLVSTYSTGSHGYTQAWDGQTVVLAHRVVWEHHNGPIEDGWTVDHTCHNKRCVNVEHLRYLTSLDNARRNKAGRDWPLGQCVNGHPDSIYWRPKSETRTKGYCHACRMDLQRRRRKGVAPPPR